MNDEYARNFSDLSHPSSVSGAGAYSEYIVPGNKQEWKDLAQGSTVIIEDIRDGKVVWLSGQIVEMKALSPFMADREWMLYSRAEDQANSLLDGVNGPHSEQQLVAKVKLEVELERVNGHFSQSPIQKPASIRSKMRIPSMSSINPKIPSIADILGLKKQGVEVGFYGAGNEPREDDGKFLPYHLDIENLDNKHHFIVGESGSGKTVLLKKMAMEFRKSLINDQHPRVIMTDVQGDLLQLLMPSLVGPIKRKGWQKRIPNSESVEDALDTMGPFQLILPVSKNQDEKDMAAIKRVVEQNGHSVINIGLRLQDIDDISEVEYLLRLASEQAITVLEDEMDFYKSKDVPSTLDRLTSRLEFMMRQAEDSEDGDKQIATSQGTKFYKSTFLASLRGLRHLKDWFDHHEESMLRDENPLNCLKFDGTSVFYLEHLDPEERIMWGMQLVKWLYENKRQKGEFFVFIDEAHQLVPAKPPEAGKRGTFLRLRDNFEKLAREGRKFGINLILGTQSPKDLHEIVPQQCPTKIVMKINKSNSRAAELEESESRIASRFGQGQMYLKSPFNDTPDFIRLHSPAPPLPHQSMTNFWDDLRREAKKNL